MKIIRKSDQSTRALFSLNHDLDRYFAEQNVDPDDFIIELSPAEEQELVRRELHTTIGDTETRLDMVNDLATIALSALATLLRALETATTLGDLKAAMAPYSAALIPFAEAVEAAETVLPYRTKGELSEVITNMAEQLNRESQIRTDPTPRTRGRA